MSVKNSTEWIKDIADLAAILKDFREGKRKIDFKKLKHTIGDKL